MIGAAVLFSDDRTGLPPVPGANRYRTIATRFVST
jgi:hypothetical protein